MNRIALIPTFEPDEKLISLIENLSKSGMHIIVVNDGSGEEYKDIFYKIKEKAHIISYEENKGKGYALKRGLQFIKENFKNEYIVVTMDSDGQHTIEDATKLCDYIQNNMNDIALGKRIRDKNTPLRSKLGNEITKIVYHISTGTDIYDTQTGLRAFSNYLIDTMLEIPGNRYEYEMNVLLVLPQKRIKIKEIEIETIYINNNSNSHFNALKDSIRIYKQIIKFSLSSLISFFIDYLFYSIMTLITKNVVTSNIIARLISGTANYTMNKKLVFNNKSKVTKSVALYIILAVIILLFNTTILNVFVNIFKWNAFVSKIIVEIILFVFSWITQKKLIFKEKGEKKTL